ncbi:non-lysosomal glucosylceramidase [bacterium]|nr:non-lysosomal glucosylceramidase [bacterium]
MPINTPQMPCLNIMVKTESLLPKKGKTMAGIKRRDFLKKGAIAAVTGSAGFVRAGTQGPFATVASNSRAQKLEETTPAARKFNGPYRGEHLNRLAFPLGGIGAGMVCLEGNGCISHVSVRNTPDVFNTPFMFAAISVKDNPKSAKVVEGPLPAWKIFGGPGAGNGAGETSYGFPRFEKAFFVSRFPFGTVHLEDEDMPLSVQIAGWSPFIPGDADNSSLPMAALEYHFENRSAQALQAVFSYHSYNFMKIETPSEWGGVFEPGDSIRPLKNGFVLAQGSLPGKPHYQGDFAIFTMDDHVVVDHRLFRGGWWDARTILWKDIEEGHLPNDAPAENSLGASLYVPFQLRPGEQKVIPLMLAWYVPHSKIRVGKGPGEEKAEAIIKACDGGENCFSTEYTSLFYEPWYAGKFENVEKVAAYWTNHYAELKSKSELFSDTFYAQTLPPEVIEAVAANLTILKSPTVLRQKDGKLWAWEGCHDRGGCCHGSCTHVWNYAQAICHLFPDLERTLRETEFTVDQSDAGHQTFRAALPIREIEHSFHAAADGQLGGIMKVYREWRISGDTAWLARLWPKVKQSMDYCITQWDPKAKGVVEEPHHNTYDIEFWGPDGMCTSFYLGALFAMTRMGAALGKEVAKYKELLQRGKKYMETKLFDGEYFNQQIVWEGLRTPSPLAQKEETWNVNYSAEALELLKKEGPKYQYGSGCLSDGVLGCWIAKVCGLDDFIDPAKVRSHLRAVHQYNLKTDLSDHVNPQRPAYACGKEGGLLLCTWPKGGKLTLPFVYSNEVWTGIEYQVASHLMLMGEVEKGLEIVREARKRYDGRVRNPFNEYECGHWYARAMSSYGLLQGLTGIRYDAVEQTLYIDSKIGSDFESFLSTATGFATVGLKQGTPFIEVKHGDIHIVACLVSGRKMKLER